MDIFVLFMACHVLGKVPVKLFLRTLMVYHSNYREDLYNYFYVFNKNAYITLSVVLPLNLFT